MCVFKNLKLVFGQFGLILLRPLRLNSKKIFKFKIFLKKAVKKGDKTKRNFLWNAFPNLPLTKKNLGSRMGKGKGKLATWQCTLYTGHILLEFKNLRNGRAFYFFRQLNFKLKGLTRIYYKKNINLFVKQGVMHKTNTSYQSYW